jgi:hypothetical protein
VLRNVQDVGSKVGVVSTRSSRNPNITVPDVSTNEMPAVWVHAFIWLMIRARKSAGVGSMKFTVSLRVADPQHFEVTTAMRKGSTRRIPRRLRQEAPRTGAFTGLSVTAVFAALTSRRFGRVFKVHTSGSLPSPRYEAWAFV